MDVRSLLQSAHAFLPPAGILERLTDEQADRRVAGAPHSIGEVVAHLGFWQTWFLDRCRGAAPAPLPAAAAGWPDAQGRWAEVRLAFLTGLDQAVALAGEAAECARPLDPAIDFPPLARYTVGHALAHIAVHNAHHLGQVVTLRQQIDAWPPPSGSWTW